MKINENFQIILFISIFTIIIHLFALCLGGYGIFRDELYYLACANHPDIGYVDHPPLSIWILSAWKLLFGDSIFSIRFLPAIFSGLMTLIILILTKEFGGKKFALFLSGSISVFTPIFLAFFSIYNMNFWDLILWATIFLIINKLTISKNQKYWIWIGLLIGLGALNKVSMLWLGSGLFIGILFTSNRYMFRGKNIWLAGLLSLLIFTPFIIWNITNDFAHLDFMRNAASEKYASQNPITFFFGLLLLMNPFAAPIWIAGFWFLMLNKDHRVIGIAVIFVLALLLINFHSKSEYFISAMTVLIPAGAVWIENFFNSGFWRRFRIPYLSVLILSGLILLPMGIDFLPVRTFINYQTSLGISSPSTEGKKLENLPQFFADRFGWKIMAKEVSKAYSSLSDVEKKNTLIYCRNYGEAGAIDYYRKEYELPQVICPHNSYWYWSKKHLFQKATIIYIGIEKEKLTDYFEEIIEEGIIYSDYAMPYENNLQILICRKLKMPIEEFWNKRKIFI